MSTTPFRVFQIVWETSGAHLPEEVTIELPNTLTDLGVEDFEPDADTRDGEDDDFWDDYEPTDDAYAAFSARWNCVIRSLIEEQFGRAVVSIGGFRPA